MSCRGSGYWGCLEFTGEGVCKCQVFLSLGEVETGQKQGLGVAQAFLIQSKQIKPGKRAGERALPHANGHRQLWRAGVLIALGPPGLHLAENCPLPFGTVLVGAAK